MAFRITNARSQVLHTEAVIDGVSAPVVLAQHQSLDVEGLTALSTAHVRSGVLSAAPIQARPAPAPVAVPEPSAESLAAAAAASAATTATDSPPAATGSPSAPATSGKKKN